MNERIKKFGQIYSGHKWLGRSLSGPGSDEENVAYYISYVNKLLGSNPGLSVCDIGCGDFSTSVLLDQNKYISYLGLDLVDHVIDINQKRFGNSKRKFLVCDVVTDIIPDADVYLLKDVLQHLSIDSIDLILSKIKEKKGAILIVVNDFKKQRYIFKGLAKKILKNQSLKNCDIGDGETRPLDLRDEPFSLVYTDEKYFNARFFISGVKYTYQKQLLKVMI